MLTRRPLYEVHYMYDMLAERDPDLRLERHYTLSDLAYSGLGKLLLPPKAQTHSVQPIPVSSALGVDYILERKTQSLEGLSWKLFILAFNYSDPALWLDTRPPHIRKQHEIQANGLSDYADPSPSHRAQWYYSTQPGELVDDPSSPEVQGTLRHKRCLTMDKPTRQLYASLAILHRMDTRTTRRHSQGALISASLEALGLGWLSPPDGFRLYLDRPNPSKLRAELHYSKTLGNKDGSVFDYSRDQMADMLKPVRTPAKTTYTEEDYQRYIDFDLPELAQKAREYLDKCNS